MDPPPLQGSATVGVGGGHDRFRRGYDEVAREYLEHFGDELAHKPLDRALLAALLEETPDEARLADIGCGPGHVAAWLASRGASVVGIDLSPKMVEIGRSAYPEVKFREGDLVSLPAADGEFDAVVCFYSIIHLEPAELPLAFSEIQRTLGPAGRFLISFHLGSEVVHRSDWWGHAVDVDFRYFEREPILHLLQEQGLIVEAELERRNYPEEAATRRGYVMGRRA
jgi:SAM-dependent methyltransferase